MTQSMTPEPPKKNTTPPHRVPINHRLTFWFFILFLIIFIAMLRQQTQQEHSKNRKSQRTLVVLAKVNKTDVPIYLNALGNVLPINSVTVRTQVNGQLIRVHYHEGQMIKAGELLAEIDSRPYQAQLLQYHGQLQRDQAQLINARIDLKRYQKLWKEKSVSQQVLATQIALVKQLEGTIQLDQGLVDAAKINLTYCKITSPVHGRIGLNLVDAGNIVQTSDSAGIAVINTLNPITVTFAIPEDHIPEIMPSFTHGEKLSVQVYDREQNHLLATGILTASDNQVDPSTGTVKLKATFPNEKNTLFPNQFVNVRLLVKTLHQALVIPTAAIQQSPKGSFVYLLNQQTSTVKQQPVTTGTMLGSMTVITSGLTLGQSVIEQGADKLTDGAKVILPNQSSSTALSSIKYRHHLT